MRTEVKELIEYDLDKLIFDTQMNSVAVFTGEQLKHVNSLFQELKNYRDNELILDRENYVCSDDIAVEVDYMLNPNCHVNIDVLLGDHQDIAIVSSYNICGFEHGDYQKTLVNTKTYRKRLFESKEAFIKRVNSVIKNESFDEAMCTLQEREKGA